MQSSEFSIYEFDEPFFYYYDSITPKTSFYLMISYFQLLVIYSSKQRNYLNSYLFLCKYSAI